MNTPKTDDPLKHVLDAFSPDEDIQFTAASWGVIYHAIAKMREDNALLSARLAEMEKALEKCKPYITDVRLSNEVYDLLAAPSEKAELPRASRGFEGGGVAWLIERIHPLEYWTGTSFDFERASTWTTDANRALKLGRDESVVLLMALGRFNSLTGEQLTNKFRTAEHEWVGTESSEQGELRSPVAEELGCIDCGYPLGTAHGDFCTQKSFSEGMCVLAKQLASTDVQLGFVREHLLAARWTLSRKHAEPRVVERDAIIEECAKVCEKFMGPIETFNPEYKRWMQAAAAIRALSGK